MQAGMMFANPFEIFFMISMFAGWGMPLGMPPSPADPVVERAAPEECLYYLGWSGMAVADPKSANQTERLLAEPELRQFADRLGTQIVAAVRQKSKGNLQAEIVAEELPGLLKTLATHPTALYVAEVRLSENTIKARGGLVVNAGADAAAAAAAMSKLEAILAGDLRGAKIDEVSIAGVKLRRLTTDPQAPVVLWGFKNNLFLATLGDEEAKALVERVSSTGKPASWLQDIRRQLPVERPAMTSYLNVELGLKLAAPAITDPGVKAQIQAFGLAGVKCLVSVSGLNATAAVTRSRVNTAGHPDGLLSLVSTQSVTLEDLKVIPREATGALIARFNASSAYEKILKMSAALGDEEAKRLPQAVGEAEKHLELRLVDDVLKPLGDSWTVSSTSSGIGGMGNPFAGLMLTATIADRAKLVRTNEHLLKVIRGDLQQDGGTLNESTVGDTKFYSVQFPGPLQLAPAWAITDSHLIVAANAQDLTTFLHRSPLAESLADVKAMQTLLSSGKGASILIYQDTAATLAQLYASAQMMAPLMTQGLAQQGIDFSLPPLPTLAKLQTNITPTITLARSTSTGLASDKYHSAPATVDTTWVAPLMVVAMLPATRATRQAAGRNQSTNNLHQIGIAMQNHHDSFKKFPAPAIYDKQDKPLLSWRVKLLPYLEEGQLYREFRLDEPWDSEHNKKLIARMPSVYADPNNPQLAAAHKTRYLLPTGPAALFQDKKGVNMRQITDGTSKTLMMVEALPDRAVIWTKPDDLEIDPKNPLAGLKGSPGGGFLAGWCDAAVRMIGDKTDDETMRRLFNPRDGLPVDQNKILGPAR